MIDKSNGISAVLAGSDGLFLQVLEKILLSLGAEVRGLALDGEQALRLCREQRPDWFFTGYGLPKLNCLEVVHQLRAERLLPRTMVISQNLDDNEKRALQAANVSDFCDKRLFQIDAFRKQLAREFGVDL